MTGPEQHLAHVRVHYHLMLKCTVLTPNGVIEHPSELGAMLYLVASTPLAEGTGVGMLLEGKGPDEKPFVILVQPGGDNDPVCEGPGSDQNEPCGGYITMRPQITLDFDSESDSS